MKTSIRLFIAILFVCKGVSLHAQDVTTRIVDYHNGNKRDSAMMLINQYLPIYEQKQLWDSVVMLNRFKAIVFAATKTPAEAVAQSRITLALANKHLIDTTYDYRLTVLKHGNTLSTNFLFDEAETAFKRVIDIAEKHGDRHGFRARAYSDLAYNLFIQKNYTEAIAMAEKSYALMVKNPNIDSVHYGNVFKTLGNTYEHMLLMDSVLKYKNLYLELMTATHPENHPNIGIAFNDFGGFYLETGQFDKALDYYRKTEDIFYKDYLLTGQGRYLAVALNNIGYIYSIIGEYELSNEYYDKSLQLDIQDYGKDHPALYDIYSKLLDNSLDAGDLEQSTQYYVHALNVLNNMSEFNLTEYNMLELIKVRTLSLEKKYKESASLAEKIYTYFHKKEGEYTKRCASIASQISSAYLELGDYETSKKWALKNFQIVDSVFNVLNPQYITSTFNLLTIYLKSGDRQSFENLYDQILKNNNNGTLPYSPQNCIPQARLMNIFSIRAEFLKQELSKGNISIQDYDKFLKDFIKYFNIHLSVVRSNGTLQSQIAVIKGIFQPSVDYFSEHDPQKAFLYIESSRSLITRINLQSQLISSDIDPNSPKNKIDRLLNQMQEENDNKVFIELGGAIETLYEYKDSLRNADINEFTRRFGFTEVDIKDLADILHKDEALIEFAIIDSTLYVFTYYNSKVTSKKVSAAQVFSKLEGAEHLEKDMRRSLFSLLIPKEVISAKRLLIVPDSKLYFLPFESLIDDSGKELIHSKVIRYAYSGIILHNQNLLSKRNKGANKNNILGITPGFMESLKKQYINSDDVADKDSSWLSFIQQPFLLQLSEKFKTIARSKNLVDSMATEQAYKSSSADFKILHFGTHGLLDDSSPLLSKLIFAKDKEEDGYLHTYEIYGQNLNADLAVLTACETGRGKILDGDGMVSLAHAFTYAGCPSVLISLWNIDEKSTAQIIENFYENLLDGSTKSEALHKAKLDFLKSSPPQLHDPYYWAGLIIMGSDDPLFSPSWYDQAWVKWLLAGVVLILIIGLVVRFVPRNVSVKNKES